MNILPATGTAPSAPPAPRLLVFDCHEAWVYQLRLLGRPLDIVVGLRGRALQDWDRRMRPVPEGARLLRLEQALRAPEPYACIVAHNLTDLLEARSLAGPRLLVLHEMLEGSAAEQNLAVPLDEFRSAVARFVQLTGTHVVAVSQRKARSWGLDAQVVSFCADPEDYLPWGGELAAGLRIANAIARRPRTLRWDFHRQAFDGLPVTLVGRNPELPGVRPAEDWSGLKRILSRHRFYIHTADPQMEDGYNMATLEAMAAGLPVLGNPHPSSPVEHGVSGFLSDDPAALRACALRLLADRGLARRMGRAARETVRRRFGPQAFREGFLRAIGKARQEYSQCPPVAAAPASAAVAPPAA